MTMTYEAWRISHQDAEQAARAAYEAATKHAAERDAIAAHVEQLDTLATRFLESSQETVELLRADGGAPNIEALAAELDAIASGIETLDKPEIGLAQRDASMQAKGARLVATRAWERTQWETLGVTPQEQAANLATIVANELSRSAVETSEGGAA